MALTAKQVGDTRVEIYENGSYVRCITTTSIKGISCDGINVGILRSDRVELYQCKDGQFIRTINQTATSIQVNDGVVILQINGRFNEYDIRSGNLNRIYG